MIKFSEQPLSITKIWQAGFGIYKATFAKVWYLLFAIGIMTSGSLLLPKTFSHNSVLLNHPLITSKTFGLIALVMLMLVGLYLGLLLLHRIYRLIVAKDEPLKNSSKIVLKKYGTCILNLIYVMLIFIGIMLVFCLVLAGIVLLFFLIKTFIPALAAWFIGAQKLMTWIGIALLVIGFVCMFVITEAVLIATFPLILFENNSAWSAIKKSLQLAWGNVWRVVAGVYFPVSIIMLPFFIINLIISINYPQNAILSYSYYIAYIVIHAFLTVPLQQSLVLAQFNDLKLRRKIITAKK